MKTYLLKKSYLSSWPRSNSNSLLLHFNFIVVETGYVDKKEHCDDDDEGDDGDDDDDDGEEEEYDDDNDDLLQRVKRNLAASSCPAATFPIIPYLPSLLSLSLLSLSLLPLSLSSTSSHSS